MMQSNKPKIVVHSIEELNKAINDAVLHWKMKPNNKYSYEKDKIVESFTASLRNWFSKNVIIEGKVE